jgi:hypothetical protein
MSTTRVGIGTASPAASLAISVASAASDGTKGLRITNPAGTAVMLECGSSGDSFVGTTSGSDFNIRTNNANIITTTFAGNVGIGTTTPAVKLDVVGNIRSSTGILFGTDTAAANALDDYEEGTWTPVLKGSTSDGTYVYDTARTGGYYTKIGRQVHLIGVYRVSSITSAGSGDALISGIPFAPSAAIPSLSYVRTNGILTVQGGPTLSSSTIFTYADATLSSSIGMGYKTTSNWTAIDVTDADEVDAVWWFSITYFV